MQSLVSGRYTVNTSPIHHTETGKSNLTFQITFIVLDNKEPRINKKNRTNFSGEELVNLNLELTCCEAKEPTGTRANIWNISNNQSDMHESSERNIFYSDHSVTKRTVRQGLVRSERSHRLGLLSRNVIWLICEIIIRICYLNKNNKHSISRSHCEFVHTDKKLTLTGTVIFKYKVLGCRMKYYIHTWKLYCSILSESCNINHNILNKWKDKTLNILCVSMK